MGRSAILTKSYVDKYIWGSLVDSLKVTDVNDFDIKMNCVVCQGVTSWPQYEENSIAIATTATVVIVQSSEDIPSSGSMPSDRGSILISFGLTDF